MRTVTVKVAIDEKTYARLVKKRKENGLPSVAAYLLWMAGELDDHAEAGEIVKKAVAIASKKTVEVSFRLRDLFPSTEWSSFTKGARVRAGRMFFEQVGEALDGIAIGKKGSGGHQLYVRH